MPQVSAEPALGPGGAWGSGTTRQMLRDCEVRGARRASFPRGFWVSSSGLTKCPSVGIAHLLVRGGLETQQNPFCAHVRRRRMDEGAGEALLRAPCSTGPQPPGDSWAQGSPSFHTGALGLSRRGPMPGKRL